MLHPQEFDVIVVGGGHAGTEAALAAARMGCATALPQGAFVADEIARALRGEEPRRFSFGYFVQCVSLGRERGMIQKVDAWDRPSDFVLSGRFGALVKEGVCRFARGSLSADRRGLAYAWPSAPKPTIVPALHA